MTTLNRNISGLNTIYDVQLRNGCMRKQPDGASNTIRKRKNSPHTCSSST